MEFVSYMGHNITNIWISNNHPVSSKICHTSLQISEIYHNIKLSYFFHQ